MNSANRYLSGFLLVLIGVLVGGLVVLLQEGHLVNDHSNVDITTIKRSEKPLFTEDELEKLDTRFLFKNVAERTTPSVVYISSIVSLDEDSDQSFWNHFHERHARTVGSGVIVAPDGYIITNNHVIRGAVDEGISVILNDKRAYDARVVGADPTTDLAILKIDANHLPSITIGNSDEVKVGEWVLAIGNPFRLRSTVTAGIVSALSRQVQISGESNSRLHIDSFIQTDAAINKGNSGGALVNTSGELIGINTAIATESGSYQGYGFAVPSNLASKVMSDLIQYGEVHRALLGVSIISVDFQRAQDLRLDAVKGVEIRSITKNGAARKSNLQRNDVILKVDGDPVNESNELQEKIAIHQPGDVVRLTLWRDGNLITRNVKLGKASAAPEFLSQGESRKSPPAPVPYHSDKEKDGVLTASFSLGFKIIALSRPDNPDKFDFYVARIYPSSKADRSGMNKGDIITQVNGKDIKKMEQLRKQIESKDRSKITITLETSDGVRKEIHFEK